MKILKCEFIVVLAVLLTIGGFFWSSNKSNTVDLLNNKIDILEKDLQAMEEWKDNLLHMKNQLENDLDYLKDSWVSQYNALRRWEKWKKELDKKTDTPVVIVEPQEPNFTDIVQESIKSVVHIMCPEWQGSGFVITPNIIATARHVSEKVESFDITTNEGHKLHATRAISSKKYDISLIYIDDLTCVAEKERELECKKVTHKVKLVPAKLGSIKDCKLGQQVYTIGSPYGNRNFNSVSKGIISGFDRNWDYVNLITGEQYGWEITFTSDSAVHPGNSGGPIFTMDGVVRGIVVGARSPVLNCSMPCDLFIPDIEYIKSMFIMDKYNKEKAVEHVENEQY